MKKIILLLMFAFEISSIYSQEGWVWQNPLPQGEDIYRSRILNSNTGFLVTVAGTILKTSNSGLNWNIIPTLNNTSIYDCYFVNDLTGFVVGTKMKFEKTIDGGKTWTSIPLPGGYLSYLCKIQFINNQTGYIAGSASYKTTNGGNNWVEMTNSQSALDIYFLDDNTGFIITFDYYGSYLKRTTNGGATFITQLTGAYGSQNILTVKFLDNNIGYTNIGSGYKTTNRGENWYSVSSPSPPGGFLNYVYFLNNNTGFVLYNFSFIAKTSNNGLTWDTLTLPWYVRLTTIDFFNDNVGIMSGESGVICRTSNSGLNWVNLYSGFKNTEISDIQFTDNLTGYICGGDTLFAKTTNGGINWIKYDLNFYSSSVSSLYFFDNFKGYCVGMYGNIGKTTNGGLNWTLNSISGYNLVNIKFINNNTGFISCLDGYLFKTSDSGSNWYLNYTIPGPSLNDIFFINANTGFVTGNAYSSPILKTTNTGGSWSIYNTNLQNLSSIYFINENTGFAVGYKTILKTINCGLAWSNIFTSNEGLGKIFFSSANTGYAAGIYGELVKTTNAGSTWVRLHSLTRKNISTLYFINDLTGYFAGGSGIILKTTSGGNLFGVKKINIEIPAIYSLYQNYPNPFNPSTKIKFEIAADSKGQTADVKLIIYDALGREVSVLVNEQLKAGEYEVEWNAQNFPSGVYFYRIVSGEFILTRKMVLIK